MLTVPKIIEQTAWPMFNTTAIYFRHVSYRVKQMCKRKINNCCSHRILCLDRRIIMIDTHTYFIGIINLAILQNSYVTMLVYSKV